MELSYNLNENNIIKKKSTELTNLEKNILLIYFFNIYLNSILFIYIKYNKIFNIIYFFIKLLN
jgi:hypothetical protein